MRSRAAFACKLVRAPMLLAAASVAATLACGGKAEPVEPPPTLDKPSAIGECVGIAPIEAVLETTSLVSRFVVVGGKVVAEYPPQGDITRPSKIVSINLTSRTEAPFGEALHLSELATANGWIAWTTYGYGVTFAPLDAPSSAMTVPGGRYVGIASGTIYFAQGARPTAAIRPFRAGVVEEPIAVGDWQTSQIAADDSSVAWVDFAGRRVVRQALVGGAAETVATSPGLIHFVAVADGVTYWADPTHVRSSTGLELAARDGGFGPAHVHGGYLYWQTRTTIRRVRVDGRQPAHDVVRCTPSVGHNFRAGEHLYFSSGKKIGRLAI